MAQGQAPPPIQPNQPFAPAYIAAPAPPPPKKSKTGLYVVIAVVVIVVVIIAIAATAALVNNAAASQVTVNGEDWTVNYNGATSGYFGPSPQSFTTTYTGTAGSTFTYTLDLTSSATFYTHSVTSVTVAAPFALSSESPTFPVSVTPGGNLVLTLTITMPSSGGSYVLNGAINTS